MANSYYAKIAQSVNETVLAQLTSPTPIIQDQIPNVFNLRLKRRTKTNQDSLCLVVTVDGDPAKTPNLN